jgi:hypothetical protein
MFHPSSSPITALVLAPLSITPDSLTFAAASTTAADGFTVAALMVVLLAKAEKALWFREMFTGLSLSG